jgi:hypothetical protein
LEEHIASIVTLNGWLTLLNRSRINTLRASSFCSCWWNENTSLNCGHQWACCSFLIRYLNMKSWWNDIDGTKLKNSEKNLLCCYFVHKSHVGWPGCKPRPLSIKDVI